MSITNNEKEYWNTRIQQILEEKKRQVMRDAGQENFMKAARQEAIETVLDITETDLAVEVLRERIEELKDLEAQRSAMQEVVKNDFEVIEEKLKGFMDNSYRRGYYRYGVGDLDQLLNSVAPSMLDSILNKSELGQELLHIDAQKSNIADAIMLANTPTRLRQAIMVIAKSLGIEIPGADLVS